jgi:hypothetical protein
VFENRVLGRIFGPKRDEVVGRLRKLHNEELRDLYSLPSTGCSKLTAPCIIRMIKSRRMRWAYRLLVGKPEGKRPLGRPRWRCVNNIKMNPGEIG